MITYHIFSDSVVINYNGKTVMVAKSDARYPKVIEAIERGKLQEAGLIADNTAALEIEDLLGL
jgi:hypothetical protein